MKVFIYLLSKPFFGWNSSFDDENSSGPLKKEIKLEKRKNRNPKLYASKVRYLEQWPPLNVIMDNVFNQLMFSLLLNPV
jgi:hypothetical protein